MTATYWALGRRIIEFEQEGKDRAPARCWKAGARHPPENENPSGNLNYMRAFADAWPDEPIVQQLVGSGKDCHAGFGSVTAARTLPGLARGEVVGDI